MNDMSDARSRMVDAHVAARGISDARVIDAMRATPRELFVDPGFEEFAYEDAPLPIGEGQTISQPYIVAVMVEAAAIRPGDRVLEVGAGSGYAAAVMGAIAEEVHAIERHPALARAARQRLEAAGRDNVTIHVGDGTLGWPEGAPYDAIVVSAGGPSVPNALKGQLAEGGRLVIPVGDVAGPEGQTLLRVVRTGADAFEEERLGAVRFVPLIGEEGWAATPALGGTRGRPSLPDAIAAAAEPLPDPEDPDFAAAFDRFGDRRVVLLGEATHGTSEFYRARAAITRRLIERHGFDLVAVEADWPDAAAVDRYVRHHAPRETEERAFRRFPRWMWRNLETDAFVRWLRAHNEGLADETRRAGFYGLDIYNLRASIAAVLSYLDEVDPEAARTARERYGCLTPWQRDPATYGRAVLSRGYRACEEAVVAQLQDLLKRRIDYAEKDGDRFLDAAQNARLIRSAERYYRAMYYGGPESWNLRDRHMFETLEHLLEARGPDAKAVVWAHNSHIGDARATEMGVLRDQLDLGQLCRERWGAEAALIGFGAHGGTVAAASDWDGEMEIKRVRPSLEGSFERACHDAGEARFLLDMARDPELRERLSEAMPERFIGVIYRPETERASHYVEAAPARQFDAWVWFDETRAVTPLGPEHAREGEADTYPFGL